MIPHRDIVRDENRNYSYSSPVRKDEGSSAPERRTASSSSGWRDSNDYRKEYFEKNHGIAGKMFICSQCFKPMFSKSKIQVDHILPPSRVVFGSGNSKMGTFLARVMNNSFNCAAICPECNRRKSNKLGFVVVRGYFMKSLEVTANLASYLAVAPVAIVAYTLYFAGKLFKRKGR